MGAEEGGGAGEQSILHGVEDGACPRPALLNCRKGTRWPKKLHRLTTGEGKPRPYPSPPPLTTPEHYDLLLARCRQLFLAKTHDYGTAWRILRLPSVTDQIFIKANRIRTIQEVGSQQIADGVDDEFVAIVNYCLIALMQLHLPAGTPLDMTPDAVAGTYDYEAAENRRLLLAKNHDYGEAWRQMRVASITDLILMKLHRVKQLENLGGIAQVSEGVEGSYRDMLNYAVFALILRGA